MGNASSAMILIAPPATTPINKSAQLVTLVLLSAMVHVLLEIVELDVRPVLTTSALNALLLTINWSVAPVRCAIMLLNVLNATQMAAQNAMQDTTLSITPVKPVSLSAQSAPIPASASCLSCHSVWL